MRDDVKDIREHYDASVDEEHTRLERHPIERDVTWRYLDTYLPDGGNILDVGAATGAYTIPLARRGFHVTAVDFSSSLLKVCAQRAIDEQLQDRVHCVIADARDLYEVRRSDFDAALVMGPLYHLVARQDREAVVHEVYNKLKPAGIIISVFISRYGIWGDIINDNPDSIDSPAGAELILTEGRDPFYTEWGRTFRAYFASVPEIVPLHEQLGFETVALAGAEPVGATADRAYAALDPVRRRKWLDLMYGISREPSVLGSSIHLLYIGRKR